jgi:hypothetical protein
MSSPPIPGDGPSSLPRSLPDAAPESVAELFVAARQTLARLVQEGVDVLTRPIRALAFWSAIALPFLNMALLFHGLSTTAETTTFLVLVVANLVALYVGHSHRRDG